MTRYRVIGPVSNGAPWTGVSARDQKLLPSAASKLARGVAVQLSRRSASDLPRALAHMAKLSDQLIPARFLLTAGHFIALLMVIFTRVGSARTKSAGRHELTARTSVLTLLYATGKAHLRSF